MPSKSLTTVTNKQDDFFAGVSRTPYMRLSNITIPSLNLLDETPYLVSWYYGIGEAEMRHEVSFSLTQQITPSIRKRLSCHYLIDLLPDRALGEIAEEKIGALLRVVQVKKKMKQRKGEREAAT